MENSEEAVSDSESGVRLIVLHLPEDEGSLGFRLTRTQWDPYPWVRDVTAGSAADDAGLVTGDCLLQVDGRDLLGLTVGRVASLIRGDGGGGAVRLAVWSCGVDPRDDPELLWSAGGGAAAERSRRALSAALGALACCVCACTARRALTCAHSHLYCEACWARLERCALCREQLPPKDSPYARNLVAEQVFEAIAKEYDLKSNAVPKTSSVCNTPTRSPCLSPSTSRKVPLPAINRFAPKRGKGEPNYSSDPNIHRSSYRDCRNTQNPTFVILNCEGNAADDIGCCATSQCNKSNKCSGNADSISCTNIMIAHKLVARLRPACSMVDLKNSSMQECSKSGSLNDVAIGRCVFSPHHTGSLGDLKKENTTHLTKGIQ